jgi:hypothetical protein
MLVKYKGTDVTIYMATTAGALTTNSPVGNIQSITWKVDQGMTQEPSGFGSRGTVAKEGTIKITGTLKRDYDETVVDTGSSATFAEEAHEFQTLALTAIYLRVIINASGLKYTFYPTKGTYTPNAGSVDGIVQEQYDFMADAVYST